MSSVWQKPGAHKTYPQHPGLSAGLPSGANGSGPPKTVPITYHGFEAFIDHSGATPTRQLETEAGTKPKFCDHNWVKYEGFNHDYEFCTECDEKRPPRE